MKICVTGGAGFIGSHITDSMINQGHEVVVLDNFSSGDIRNLNYAKEKGVKIIEGDILDKKILNKAFEGCDFVSHHAAQLEIFLAVEDPLKDLEINTQGTMNVFQVALENRVKKVINASSACVYGQTDHILSEDDSQIPNWDYGVSKLAAERYGIIFSNYKGLPVTSLRYAIVYGQREWFRRVLPIYVKRVLSKESPVVFGQGEQVRDFINVFDAVSFHNSCIFNKDTDGEVFNVGTGIGTSVKSLAELTCSMVDHNLTPIFEEIAEGDFSAYVTGKKRNTAELKNMILDIKKAKEVLGWSPKIDLKAGLKMTFDWVEKNPDRWQKIYSTRW